MKRPVLIFVKNGRNKVLNFLTHYVRLSFLNTKSSTSTLHESEDIWSHTWLKRHERNRIFFVSLQKSVVVTQNYNIVVNSKELIATQKISDAIYEVSHKPMSL
jgi:hypothetical protein